MNGVSVFPSVYVRYEAAARCTFRDAKTEWVWSCTWFTVAVTGMVGMNVGRVRIIVGGGSCTGIRCTMREAFSPGTRIGVIKDDEHWRGKGDIGR